MKIPKGVTGFFTFEETKPPQVDGKQFKQILHYCMNRNDGKIIEFIEPRYPMNYYSVQVEIFQKQLHILLNEHYPLLAFARITKYENIDFVDEPLLVQEFSPFYQVLQTTELNKPLNLSLDLEKWMLQNDYQFNEAELEEIVLRNPETIGEILFNHWD